MIVWVMVGYSAVGSVFADEAGVVLRNGLTKLGTNSSVSASLRMVRSSSSTMILVVVTLTISLRGIISSESRKLLSMGRLTMIWLIV